MNHYKTIGDVLRQCKTLGRIIVLPEVGLDNNFKKYDYNLFQSLKVLMYKNGGEYYLVKKIEVLFFLILMLSQIKLKSC